jgi:hypothetical protein
MHASAASDSRHGAQKSVRIGNAFDKKKGRIAPLLKQTGLQNAHQLRAFTWIGITAFGISVSVDGSM